MNIRAFSPSDYANCIAVHNTIFTNQPATVEGWQSEDDNRHPKFVHHRFVAEQDGQLVGVVVIEEAHWSYAPGKYYVNVMVHPDFQQHGIGTALYEHAVQAVQQPAPDRFIADTRDDQAAGIRFLDKHGFVQISRHPTSRLDVQNFDPQQFDAALQKVAAVGINIVTGTTLLQEDPSYWTKPDFEEYVASRTDERRGYSSDLWFIAVEEIPDEKRYVGLSTLWHNGTDPNKLNTGWTGVARSHRRHGLARALKVATIDYAKRAGMGMIETTNEEHNPMFRLNIELGFRDVFAWLGFEKQL